MNDTTGTFHAHVRDQLASAIESCFSASFARRWRRDTAHTAANRCIHILVLLGVLPETDQTADGDDLPGVLRRAADRTGDIGIAGGLHTRDLHRAADEIERLRAALREIRALHQPEWASEEAKAAGKEPWVCALCGTADGGWPCATTTTIREVLGDE